MKHFFLIINREKDREGKVTARVRDYLKKKGAVCVCCSGCAEQKASYRYTDPAEIPPETECVIVLGGDGTLIQAARDLVHTDYPLLGINMGTLGYLAEVDLLSIEQTLDCLLENRFYLEKRMMLCGRIYRDGALLREDIALNDIVISRSGRLCVLHYHVMVDGEPLNDYLADALITSTPTGSTAYNMSAGGPVVSPQASLFVLTPVCSHSLNARSIVLPDSVKISVETVGEMKYPDLECLATFDGDGPIRLFPGDLVEITKANCITRLIKLSRVSFLETLRRKMI